MTITDAQVEAAARAICRSRKFESGQGTCALACMDQIGDARAKGCGHAVYLYGALVRAALEAADRVRQDDNARLIANAYRAGQESMREEAANGDESAREPPRNRFRVS